MSEVRSIEGAEPQLSSSTDVYSATPPERSLLESPLEREPSIHFDLYGNQFRFRAADRASKKFKSKKTIEL